LAIIHRRRLDRNQLIKPIKRQNETAASMRSRRPRNSAIDICGLASAIHGPPREDVPILFPFPEESMALRKALQILNFLQNYLPSGPPRFTKGGSTQGLPSGTEFWKAFGNITSMPPPA
jgi:hypothetical protein